MSWLGFRVSRRIAAFRLVDFRFRRRFILVRERPRFLAQHAVAARARLLRLEPARPAPVVQAARYVLAYVDLAPALLALALSDVSHVVLSCFLRAAGRPPFPDLPSPDLLPNVGARE
ncbi:hypothetical protein, partial [Burkholderia pseudomallei]|uniref:hypothetical protein n=1 Tax=Burkholderia pseudomallei TaxID=28450 RepID=UPI001C3D4C30